MKDHCKNPYPSVQNFSICKITGDVVAEICIFGFRAAIWIWGCQFLLKAFRIGISIVFSDHYSPMKYFRLGYHIVTCQRRQFVSTSRVSHHLEFGVNVVPLQMPGYLQIITVR
jgi:hypothetical protein